MACIVCNPTNATVEQLNHRYNTVCGVGFDIAQQCGKHDEQTVRKEAKKAIYLYFKSTPYPEQPNSTRALLHPHVQAGVLETQDCYLCCPNDALLEKCVFRLSKAKFTLQHFPVCEEHMIDTEVFEKAGKESFMFLAEQTVAMNMAKAEEENEPKKKKRTKKMNQGESQANEAENERLADNTGKVLEIAKAWAQIEIAHTSLKNAYETLKTFDRKQLPAKVLKAEMRNLRKIAKDMAGLGMKEEKAADEDVKGDDEQTESKDEKDMDKGREVGSEDDDSYATGVE